MRVTGRFWPMSAKTVEGLLGGASGSRLGVCAYDNGRGYRAVLSS